MRTWVKASLWTVGVVVLCFLALSATGAYFVLRSMEKKASTEAETLREVDLVRTRFAGRPPLIEIISPRPGDIRVNRQQSPDARPISTIHVIAWKAEDRQMTRAEIPVWLMRFSTVNVLSQLGVAPAEMSLTLDDVRRYGPGIIVDFATPGKDRVLVWVD